MTSVAWLVEVHRLAVTDRDPRRQPKRTPPMCRQTCRSIAPWRLEQRSRRRSQHSGGPIVLSAENQRVVSSQAVGGQRRQVEEVDGLAGVQGAPSGPPVLHRGRPKPRAEYTLKQPSRSSGVSITAAQGHPAREDRLPFLNRHTIDLRTEDQKATDTRPRASTPA
jgi:hypothetical protein